MASVPNSYNSGLTNEHPVEYNWEMLKESHCNSQKVPVQEIKGWLFHPLTAPRASLCHVS